MIHYVALGLISWVGKMTNAVMYMKHTFLKPHVSSRMHRQEKLVFSKSWISMFGYTPENSKRKEADIFML